MCMWVLVYECARVCAGVCGCMWMFIGVSQGVVLRGFLDGFWFNVVNIVLMMFFHLF